MSVLVEAHSLLRWLVLLAAAVALVAVVLDAARGGLRGVVRGSVAGYAAALTVQFLLGLVLWLGQARWDGEDVFLSWIHPPAMLAAVGVAHAGLARVRRAGSDAGATRSAGVFTLISVGIVLAAIPW